MLQNQAILTLTLTFSCLLLHAFALDQGVCSVCPTNMYCTNNTITRCPANSESPIQSQSHFDCICTAGYNGFAGGPCTACPAGSYKTQNDSNCISCPVGTSSGFGSTSCSSCPANMTIDSNDVSKCSCNKGYGFNGLGTCQACITGQFKNTVSNESCSLCVPNSITNVSSATQCFCVEGFDMNIETGSCQCAPRYGASELSQTDFVTCAICRSGTYKSTSGNGRCQECDPNTYSAELGNLKCKPCEIHSSVYHTAASSCLCDAGYTYDMNLHRCVPCDTGFFKKSSGNVECLPCPISKYTDVQGSSDCSRCRPNTSTNSVGKDSEFDCMCGVGYGYIASNASCASCPMESYKANVSNDECVSKTDDGYYINLRVGTNSANLTESSRQILKSAVAGSLNIDISMVRIISVQDLAFSSITRRLLQDGSNALLLVFVDSSTVEISKLTDETINQYLTENYDDEVIPSVSVEGIDFVKDKIFNPTVLLATATPSQTSPILIWVILIAGGVSIVVLVVVLTWYYCRKSMDDNISQNHKFEMPISIPELSRKQKERCLDIADFYKFSKRSTIA